MKLLIVAVTPGIALALLIYYTDRYDREPIGLLLRMFLLGGLSTIVVLVVEEFLTMIPPLLLRDADPLIYRFIHPLYTAFLVAGFTEEWMKRKITLMVSFDHSAFNEKLDGIVYAVMVSLGFATVENIMYVVFGYAGNASIGIQRAIFAVPAHMLFAITMGYYISLAKYAKHVKTRRNFLRLSLWIPVLLHGVYDYILFVEMEAVLVVFLLFVAFLWWFNLKKLNRFYRESREENRRILDNEK